MTCIQDSDEARSDGKGVDEAFPQLLRRGSDTGWKGRGYDEVHTLSRISSDMLSLIWESDGIIAIIVFRQFRSLTPRYI